MGSKDMFTVWLSVRPQEVCVLGYNVNHGQEISLRLRTDDWQGFRRRAPA